MRLVFLIFFASLSVVSYSQIDSVGSGHALLFDGTNDYLDVGNHYHDLNLPFTISAWVYLDPALNSPAPVFVTNDNNPNYRGFWFTVNSTAILCEFGDGTGGDNPAFRRGKLASVPNIRGRWVNVCAVMISPFDITLYLNGTDVGGSSSGDSGLTMASSFNGDVAKIGYFLSNGVSYFFEGAMDEVRLWNRALTSSEIQQGMCKKLNGNEPGLIGNWTFDETSGTTVYDKSVNKFNSQFHNGPQRIFSGAPIGNNSKYLYTSGWSGTTLSMTDGNDQVSASNIQGNPEGVHIYEVKNLPSQTGGLNLSKTNQPYFGVFAASLDADNKFDVSYNFQNSSSCGLFSRGNNSVLSWANSSNPTTNVLQQTEVIKTAGLKINFDLGPDQVFCNQTTSTISTGLSDPSLTYQWNNGMNTSSINVSKSGEYLVKVTGDCGSVKDSVRVTFENLPPAFSLGGDQTLCKFSPIKLTPLKDTLGYQFNWQDGSHQASFSVSTFGKYWVTIKNGCGEVSDTIKFSSTALDVTKLPNVITPNNDGKNDFYKIPDEFLGDLNLEIFNRWGRKVFQSNGYMNDWNGGDLDAGVYYLLLTGGCIDRVKDTITVLK